MGVVTSLTPMATATEVDEGLDRVDDVLAGLEHFRVAIPTVIVKDTHIYRGRGKPKGFARFCDDEWSKSRGQVIEGTENIPLEPALTDKSICEECRALAAKALYAELPFAHR